MTDYKPGMGKQVVVLLSLLVPVVAGIALTGMGYMHWMEHGLGLDMSARPHSLAERAEFLGLLLVMIALLSAVVFVIGVPWMFIMSRVLSPDDLRFYITLKGPRYPWISDAMDRLWLAMIRGRVK